MGLVNELPEPIPTYLAAHVARDADAAIPCFTADAVVVDDGRIAQLVIAP